MRHPLYGRHAREFSRALVRGEWERTGDGLYFPKQRALLHGHVKVESKHGTIRKANFLCYDPASWAAVGLLAPGGTSALMDNLYIAPWGTPINTTRAWFNQFGSLGDIHLWYVLGELGDAPEGYSEATRQAWTWADSGGNVLDNSGSPAAFTMRSATQIGVSGFVLTTQPVKLAGLPGYWQGNGIPNPVNASSVVDVSNGFFNEIKSAPETGYIPAGAIDTSPGSGVTDNFFGLGHVLSLDDGLHGADPHQGPTDLTSLGVTTQWLDLGGDDYYDPGTGAWVDPGNNSVNLTFDATSIIAIVELPSAPVMFNDMDPLNITWGIQLS